MKKKLIAGLVVFTAGFIAAFILMGYYNSWQSERDDDTDALETSLRPTTPVPPNGPIPSLSLDAFVDGADGYNLHFVTENFTFTPGLIGEASSPNTGYATVYINGRKQARVYDSWHHVSYDALAKGQNTVEVVLTANDHTQWAVGENPLQDSVMLEKID